MPTKEEKFRDTFEVLGKLGEGNFSEVFKVLLGTRTQPNPNPNPNVSLACSLLIFLPLSLDLSLLTSLDLSLDLSLLTSLS